MFMKHVTYFIFFLHSYQSTCTVKFVPFLLQQHLEGASQQVNNINVISISLLIVVIIIMMHLPCTVGIVTRCSFSFILCCLITLSIIFCWVQLDPSIYESLQKEKVEVGDVIYIEANSGAVKVWYYVLRYVQGNWFHLQYLTMLCHVQHGTTCKYTVITLVNSRCNLHVPSHSLLV